MTDDRVVKSEVGMRKWEKSRNHEKADIREQRLSNLEVGMRKWEVADDRRQTTEVLKSECGSRKFG